MKQTGWLGGGVDFGFVLGPGVSVSVPSLATSGVCPRREEVERAASQGMACDGVDVILQFVWR